MSSRESRWGNPVFAAYRPIPQDMRVACVRSLEIDEIAYPFVSEGAGLEESGIIGLNTVGILDTRFDQAEVI